MSYLYKKNPVIKALFCSFIALFPVEMLAKTAETTVQSAMPSSSMESAVKMIVGLFLVLVVIFFLAWLAKNYFGFNPVSNSSLKTIAGIAVGQKERVVLIQVSDRQMVVGVAPGRISMLHLLEKGTEITGQDEMHNSAFLEKLKNSIKKIEK